MQNGVCKIFIRQHGRAYEGECDGVVIGPSPCVYSNGFVPAHPVSVGGTILSTGIEYELRDLSVYRYWPGHPP